MEVCAHKIKSVPQTAFGFFLTRDATFSDYIHVSFSVDLIESMDASETIVCMGHLGWHWVALGGTGVDWW